MIDNTNVLLLANYLEQAHNPNLSTDEQEFQLLQLRHSLNSENNLNQRFNLSSVIEQYLRLPEEQTNQIPVIAHRWLWDQITRTGSDLPVIRFLEDDLSASMYFKIQDPFVQYKIVSYLARSQFQRLRQLLEAVSNEIERSDSPVRSLSDATLELIDILFDIQVGMRNEDTQRILNALYEWMRENNRFRDSLRDFLRLRTEYLVGQEGERILDFLRL